MASEPAESSSRWKQWERIGELLQSALEREPGERVAFLREACGDDEPLFCKVSSLLSSSEKAGDFIEKPELNVPAIAAALGLHYAGAGLKPGTAIGRRTRSYRDSTTSGHRQPEPCGRPIGSNPHRYCGCRGGYRRRTRADR
jgi:hypothetical protein